MQNGSQLYADVYTLNQLIGSGSGTISGNNVQLDITVFGLNAAVKGLLSSDKRSIKGTYTVPATGESQPMTLLKQ
ncbi:MAG: hypothetical protein ABIR19_08040 [Ginsengibacter sp.]